MEILLGLIPIVIVLLATYYLGVIKGAPFVPSRHEAVKNMIELAQLRPGEKLADIGSGDGRIVIAAAQAGAEAHGFEINPFLVLIARRKISKAGLQGRAFVHWKNFWLKDFSEFSVVTVFGLSNIMQALEKKLQKELPAGARVVSNIFEFPSWHPEKHELAYLYVKRHE